jgi:membrane-bound serine protease (ClpP class)
MISHLLFALTAFAAGPMQLIDVNGSINPGSASYITESIQRAEAEQAEAVILRLNTPGGLLSSTRDIIQGISSSKIPVITYISPGGASATSAGALITIASHVAVMAPGTNIGAAHPVGGQGEEVKGPMGEKVTNDTAALARSQAELRGRSSEAAAKIVTKSESFSPEEALKAKVIDFIAADQESLLGQLKGRKVKTAAGEITLTAASAPVIREMNLKQKFLHLIADPNISTMLIAIGGLAIYAEISSGFSVLVPGIFGLFCLLLGFVSLQTLPINVGGALLFALGFALLVAEAFVTSYGLLTVAALVALFLGGLFLMDPATTDMRVSLSLLIPMVGSVGFIMAIIGLMLYREKKGLGTQDRVVGALAKIATSEGRSGTAYVNGELWSFDSDEALQAGDEAPVQEIKSMRIQLKRRK